MLIKIHFAFTGFKKLSLKTCNIIKFISTYLEQKLDWGLISVGRDLPLNVFCCLQVKGPISEGCYKQQSTLLLVSNM